MAWGTHTHGKCTVIISAIAAPDLSAAFLGKENVLTAGEAILWAAALGVKVFAPGRTGGEVLDPPPPHLEPWCRSSSRPGKQRFFNLPLEGRWALIKYDQRR
jgi:hypothetical protein